MTIKNLYPDSRPQSIYNVINGRPELPAASTFSRASEATYVDSTGIIQTAAVDKPRFNYDPETGEFLGLLLEQSTANIFTNTYSFNSIWGNKVPPGATNNAGIAPDGSNTAFNVSIGGDNGQKNYDISNTGGKYTYSIYVKSTGGNGKVFASLNGFNNGDRDASGGVIYDFGTDTVNQGYSRKLYPDGWVRLWKTYSQNSITLFLSRTSADNDLDILYWGAQLERGELPTSLMINPSSTPVTREPDFFSLTTSSNFDGGFSLLLDSDTTTDDFLYRIKASGTTISELKNNDGTLEWDINGTSAQSDGLYPQVGFTTGRVRTVSSYGAANGEIQNNYLYTTGLSFPTPAVVAPGADELEFGVPQTLKAVYLWNGQLSDTEAVSVIKGEYNVVPNEPIIADSYSFVYNTDPTNVGENSITLPYISPTVSERIYWGDGTNQRYEGGPTGIRPIPQHTYPYPGQYRIQIDAEPDGFEATRLSDISNTITRVDAWPPNKRVDATGDGFTGDELIKMLSTQAKCELIPPFKYTGLTSLDQTFYNCQAAAVNNWDWVPTNLQLVTRLSSAFRSVCRIRMTTTERGTFPQLQTGPALTNVVECFRFNNLSQFDQGNSGLPFSNTQNVTNWTGCFRDLGKLTEIGPLDTSAATNLSYIFSGCELLAQMPFITTNNVTNFQGAWQNCEALTSFPEIDTSSGTNFSSAWSGCEALTSFPQIDTSVCINFSSSWLNCEALTSFPQIDTNSGTTFASAWNGCKSLTSFPEIDTSSGNNFSETWRYCESLTSFPALDFSSATLFSYTWSDCTNLNSFPFVDTSSATTIEGAWRYCSSLTSFPLINTSLVTNMGGAWWGASLTSFPEIDTSNCSSFGYTWHQNSFTSFPELDFSNGENFKSSLKSCANLVDFPANMFDTTGTLRSDAFSGAFQNCALTAQSIENILVSLDTNGQSDIQLSIDGGTNAAKSTWTIAANTAYDNLIAKGWTISFNA